MSANIEAVLKDPMSMTEADMERLLDEQDAQSEREIDAAVGQPDVVEAEANQADEKGGASAASKDQTDEAAQDSKDQEIDPSKAVVLTKDGKHQIPYSTLQKERERAAAAEQLMQQERQSRERLEQQLAELQRQAAETPAQAAARQAPDVAEVITTDQLNALKEEAPELGAIIEGLMSNISALRERATKAEETASRVAHDTARRQQDEASKMVEDAISRNPKLLYTRAEQPEVYNAIVEYDDLFRQRPEAAGLSLEQRLAKSIAMYEAANAAIVVPGFAKAVTTKAAIDAAPVQRGPSTLSDIPGGAAPARSEIDTLSQLNASDLTAKLMEMTPVEIDKLLARMVL